MNAIAAIEEVRQRLVQSLHPERIVLFGSHAWGVPGPDSDLDLLVIVAESDLPPHKRAQTAYRSLSGLGVPCDVIVHTRAEVERLDRVPTSLTHRALREGRVLHG